MNEDIGPILEAWPYGQGDTVRKIVGADGTEKVQIRVVIEGFHGILQFNCDGRPDGKRPHGRAFALDHHEERLRKHGESPGHRGEFRLTRRQAEELFDESSITYQRYIVLLQMNDYVRVIRDTTRNMKLFRFVHEHAADADDRNHLEKWWPYILRIHHTALVMRRLEEKDYDGALRAVEQARREIENLAPQDDEVFQAEMKRSRKALDDLVKAIEAGRPLSELETLEREKNQAVRHEDYKRAAELRDRIKHLKEREKEPGQNPETPASPGVA